MEVPIPPPLPRRQKSPSHPDRDFKRGADTLPLPALFLFRHPPWTLKMGVRGKVIGKMRKNSKNVIRDKIWKFHFFDPGAHPGPEKGGGGGKAGNMWGNSKNVIRDKIWEFHFFDPGTHRGGGAGLGRW